MVDEERVDAFGNPKVSPEHGVLTVGQDAERDGGVALVALADKDKTMTRMREEALGEKDKYVRDYPTEANKLPQFDEGDPLRYRDAILAMRSAKEGEQVTQNLMGGLAAAASFNTDGMFVATNAGEKAMLPAGAGVLAPEVLAKQDSQKLPINKELEQILAKAGGKQPLMLAGMASDPKHVDEGNLSALSPISGLPNLKAVELAQNRESGQQRSRTA